MNIYEGKLSGNGLKVGIIISRFNDFITSRLQGGAIDGLSRHGVNDDNIDIVRVPGAFEIPMMAKRLVETGKYDGIICLGAIIRGETPHFDYVAAECSKGIANIALSADIPVIYGVLTTDTVEQATDRAGAKSGNRGFDAAMSLIEMADLRKRLNK
ncbi:MAG: 6,7-dimethyl-8-ribityllumazine synthase [Candidatus Zixiibacteriota bacterium]